MFVFEFGFEFGFGIRRIAGIEVKVFWARPEKARAS